jgi:hypothetical protein
MSICHFHKSIYHFHISIAIFTYPYTSFTYQYAIFTYQYAIFNYQYTILSLSIFDTLKFEPFSRYISRPQSIYYSPGVHLCHCLIGTGAILSCVK